MWYSIGSSIVTILIVGERIFFNKAKSVVDLPDPVGPVFIIIPFGFFIEFKRISKKYFDIPKSSSGTAIEDGSKILITIDSP